MIHEDRIVLKLDGPQLPESRVIGWQYYKPYGRAVFLQRWVEVPYYFHHDWEDLAVKALHGLKHSLGE